MTPAIGSTIYIFDRNHRVYRKDAHGRSMGGPIWREHWRPVTITGETSRSRLCDNVKLPKKGGRWIADPAEIDRQAWAHEHKYRIGEMVQRTHWTGESYAVLLEIARLMSVDTSGAPALEDK